MLALVPEIISFIGLAVQAAPQVEKVYKDAKNLIQSMFNNGLITKEQQDALMSWADAHMEAVLAGQQPPEFKVE